MIALDEKALSPTARLLYDNAERISLSVNDIENDHPEASQNCLTDLGDRAVQIGMPVGMVTRKIRSDGDERGMLVYGCKFRPAVRA